MADGGEYLDDEATGAGVYGVYRNADMTEGRGPMVLDRLFFIRRDAEDYMNEKPGVMGRKPGTRRRGNLIPHQAGCPGWTCKQCWPYGGDWEIRRHRVF